MEVQNSGDDLGADANLTSGQVTQARGRATRQKKALSELLEEASNFSSAQELHSKLRERGYRVGLTTVYSQLRVLAEAGNIDSVLTPSGETLYRLCSLSSHHHHLICRDCGDAIEIEAALVESWTNEVAKQAGFTDISHTIEIEGRCQRCSFEISRR